MNCADEYSSHHLKKFILGLSMNKNDAYSLSLPLISSALLNDHDLYVELLEKIHSIVKTMENSPFKGWILGRMLFAGTLTLPQTDESLQLELLKLLDNFDVTSIDHASLDYAMFSWACGYLATANKEQYDKMQSKMLQTMTNLEQASTRIPQNHELISNALWSQIINLLAAATVHDQTFFDFILTRMKSLTGQPTITKALEVALTRTEQSSDYPAWGIAHVRLAAITIEREELAKELQLPLNNAIDDAKKWGLLSNQSTENQWKAKAEFCLGTLYKSFAPNFELIGPVARPTP